MDWKATKGSVIVASNELLDAELELARTKAERIDIYEKLVENLRQHENNVELQFRDGTRPLGDFLRAKAARLKGEIQLQREKANDESRGDRE